MKEAKLSVPTMELKGILGLSLGRFFSFDVPRSFVSFEVPLDVLVITKQALIWMDSTFA